MAADGSRGPRPFTQRHASTIFVRVPVVDWPAVKRGYKREFRGQIGRQTALFSTPTPTPCVAWSIVRGSHDARLMVLEGVWQEELGAISDASLQAEGFNTFAEFRRYWMRRERGAKFKPTKQVFVYQVRPWHPERDIQDFGIILLDRLYGEFGMEETR